MKENCLQCLYKKGKMVHETSKKVNNEKEGGSTKQSMKLRRLKLVRYCIQLTIVKNKFFQNRSNLLGP